MEIKNIPLLTIAIPTYNQPVQFKRTIMSIISQMTSEIEIVIRDDSTNDETEQIVKSYIKNKNIKYYKGEKLGIDKADFFITEKSSGKYVWWFGDDEMAPGAITHVLFLLKRYPDIDFIWINSRCKQTGDFGINLGKSRFFKDGNEVIAELADLIAFLSALLFKREKFLPHIAEAQKFVGSCLAMIYPLFCILCGNGKFYFLSEPYVIGDAKDLSKQLFFDSFYVWGVNYYQILKEFLGKFSNQAIKKALTKNFKQVWRSILVARAKNYTANFGSKSIDIFLMLKLYWNFLDFWIALPFLIMPRFMVKFFYKVYKFFIPKTLGRLGK